MYIIIIGGTTLGKYLAKTLTGENHDIIIIDSNKIVCEQIANELEIVTNTGDATEAKVLENAGIKECDAIVSLTKHDETNMVISLMAKDLGAKLVAAKLGKLDYNDRVLKRMGIDIVIHPEAAAAGYIAELITKPDVLDLAFISRGTAEILEIIVKKEMKITGKKITDISMPEDSAIVALFDKEKIIVPKDETIVKEGQKILILTKRESASKVRENIE